MGAMGREPLGPRRRSNVVPAPMASPRRAAVSRSYWASRDSLASLPSRTEPRTRGRATRVAPAPVEPFAPDLVFVGFAVVAIVDISFNELILDVVNQTAECRCARP